MRLVITDPTTRGEPLYVGDYASERGAKAQATKRLATFDRPAFAELLDADGEVVYTDGNGALEALDAGLPEPPTRPWKVRVAVGRSRSFKTEEAARAYAAELDQQGIDGEVVFGDIAPPRTCSCGCGDMTAGGRFLPGHDRKLVAMAERAARGEEGAVERLAKAEVIVWSRDAIVGRYDPEVDCHPDCLYATGNHCVCSCGGGNHNAGWGRFVELGILN